MKRGIILALAIASLAGAAPVMAIDHQDALSRFNNYIKGRCGNLLYKCQGLVVFGCQLVGNQPGKDQWVCAGDVFEKLRNPFGAPDYARRYLASSRTCEIIASYTPSGNRNHGSKKCGITPA